MLNFWKNIFRYPSFFITSMAGLVALIISPFLKLFRTGFGTGLFIVIVSAILSILYLIFNAMLNI